MSPGDRISEPFRKLMPLYWFQIVVILDEYLVTLGQFLLINQLDSIKVIFFSIFSLVDTVYIITDNLHVV